MYSNNSDPNIVFDYQNSMWNPPAIGEECRATVIRATVKREPSYREERATMNRDPLQIYLGARRAG